MVNEMERRIRALKPLSFFLSLWGKKKKKKKDMGTVVVGKVESGYVKKGQGLYLMPNKVSISK
jgi:translation elongation factor EF-1alpha